jgi:hypothetical protein
MMQKAAVIAAPLIFDRRSARVLIPCDGRSTNGSRPRQVRVNGVHDLARGMRPGDREHLGMCRTNERAALLGAEAAGHDHPAVLRQGFADRGERFLDRCVDEAAGVDDDQIGALIRRRDGISFGAVSWSCMLRLVPDPKGTLPIPP